MKDAFCCDVHVAMVCVTCHCACTVPWSFQKVSDYRCCGCEEENLHIRHCELYAGLEDITKIHRTADDWHRWAFVADMSRWTQSKKNLSAATPTMMQVKKMATSRPVVPITIMTREDDEEKMTQMPYFRLLRWKGYILLGTSTTSFSELFKSLETKKSLSVECRSWTDEILMEGKTRLPAAVGGGSARATHTAADAARRKSRRMAPLATPVSFSSLYTTIVISESDDARDLQQDGASSSE